MYGKLFASMYDGSLRNHWQAVVTLQQMVILCDRDGVVDFTPEALATRTSIPLKIIKAGIGYLEGPDPDSRTSGEEGRRIVRLDEHRSWGWRLVNYVQYRNLYAEADRPVSARERKRRQREREACHTSPVTQRDMSRMSRMSPYAEAEADVEAKGKTESKAGAVAPRPTPPPVAYLVGEDVPQGRLELVGPEAEVGGERGPGIALKGNTVAHVSLGQVALFAKAYPAVTVGLELGKMAAWSLSNPRKRKTLRGFLKFVNGWLASAQRDARLSPTTSARASSEAAYLRRLEDRP